MEESIVERVLILMKEFELTASEFADKIDVQRSSMSHLVSGRNKPSLDFIQKILNNFLDINPTWLIMGTGPMKQLDIFDLKGDVAPVQPFIIENYTLRPLEAISDTRKAEVQTDIGSEKHVFPPSTYVDPIIAKPISPLGPVLEMPIKTIYPASETMHVAESEEQIVYQKESPKVSVKIEKEAFEQPMEQKTVEKPVQTNTFQEKSAQNDKKVVKIVFFYSDNTFETFNPQ
jgi:transcriptional regulator with XRE-family HTH domain